MMYYSNNKMFELEEREEETKSDFGDYEEDFRSGDEKMNEHGRVNRTLSNPSLVDNTTLEKNV
jgi:hypothetical protein